MVESINITIGKAAENAWRYNNLRKAHNCVDKGSFYEVAFQFIEHYREDKQNKVKQINLTYMLVK